MGAYNCRTPDNGEEINVAAVGPCSRPDGKRWCCADESDATEQKVIAMSSHEVDIDESVEEDFLAAKEEAEKASKVDILKTSLSSEALAGPVKQGDGGKPVDPAKPTDVSVSQRTTTVTETDEAILFIDFLTPSGAKERVGFTKKPLGFTFYEDLPKIPLSVNRVIWGSHAEQLGVEAGWKVTAIGAIDTTELDTKTAIEIVVARTRGLSSTK